MPPDLAPSHPPADTHAPAALPVPRSPFELFVTFTLLALQGFGGVLPIAQRELVERKRWLTREGFVELFSVSQLLPGPNIVNLSLMLGDRFFGWRGAVAALGGMLLVPLAIVLALAAVYNELSASPIVAGALRGMGAVAAGLMIAMALKLLLALKRSPLGPLPCGALCIATVAAVAVLRLPLAWVVPGLGGVGMLLAAWRIGRQERRR